VRPVHLFRQPESGVAGARASSAGRGAGPAAAQSQADPVDGDHDAAFDPRDYGHPKLGELVRNQPYVEMKDMPNPTGPSALWVRLRPAARGNARSR
jgi:hypothetical protein